MDLLARISSWPVDHVGAAAVLADGRVVRAGETRTRFRLASLTKPLVALAVLVAHEEGSLDLDEPAGPPDATVRHLLAHAAGVGADDARVLAAPGTRRIYSNHGFEVLGELLAARTGMTVAAYLAEGVLGPLGTTATALEGSPAHGAVGTVDDLALVAAELVVGAPSLLAPETFDDAVRVAFPGIPGVLPGFGAQEQNDWGLGFEIRGTKAPHWTPEGADPATFGHFGRSGSLLWVEPTRRVALVVAGDRDFGDWAPPLWRALGQAVLDDQSAPDRQLDRPPADEDRTMDRPEATT